MELIKLLDITKVYNIGNLEVPVLLGISLEVHNGEFLAILGPSGSGKTTLMDIIGCLSKPTSGCYFLEGEDVSELSEVDLSIIRKKKIGFVFQSFNLIPRMSAIDNVELPLLYSGVEEEERKERAMNALIKVGLSHRAYHYPNELSGGEQQRVAIARAIVNNPSIILADEPTGNLDSKTGKEIMALFEELHKEGGTIIMVTHDSTVAKYAERNLKIKDGKIEKEEIKKRVRKRENPKKIEEKRGDRSILGSIISGFVAGYRGLLANKLRSFLTVLGIIIGVGAVIGVMGIGEGAKRSITTQIEKLGSNIISIHYRRPQTKEEALLWQGRSKGLTYQDALALKEELDFIYDVEPEVRATITAKYKDKDWETNIVGTLPSYQSINNHYVKEGRFFTEDELRSWTKVCVIGKTIKDELFEEEDPIGKEIKISNMRFTVIGVLEEKGSIGWNNFDDRIIIPLFTAQKRITGEDDIVREIQVQTKGSIPSKDYEEKVKDFLLKRHNQVEDFRIMNREEFKQTIEQTAKTFKIMLSGIAAISLIVGGIGIMNIMLVSVTERTREIGIRKAIGAKRLDILIQFLIESVIVSLSGGIIGIILGIIFATTLGNMIVGAGPITPGPRFLSEGGKSVVTPGSILLAFFFAIVVGIFFGIYPANKASKMDPAQALRYE
ncbi:MAG: ABC transporter permease [candidate division WOR-3 bacterium]